MRTAMIAILTALSMPLNAGASNIGRTAVNLTKNLTTVVDDAETFRSPCGEIALSGGIGEKGQARQAYRIATIKTNNTITQEISMDQLGQILLSTSCLSTSLRIAI